MSLKQESVNREILDRLEKLERLVAELNAKRETLKVKKPNA